MSFIDPLYPVFFVTGITVGFGHCIGMCGPIAVSLSLSLNGRNFLFSHTLCHSGRIITYTVLGGVMGASGSFARVAAHMAGLQKGIMVFTGIMVVLMGFSMLGLTPWKHLLINECRTGSIISRGFRKLSQKTSTAIYFPVGLLIGLLPCGPVYTALLAAAGSGADAESVANGVIKGMGVMMSFGIGTVPALILVGKLADMGWLKKREILYRIGATLMIIVGIYFIVKATR